MFMKDLQPYKAQDHDGGISLYVLNECAQTLHTPLETLFKYLLEDGSVLSANECHTHLQERQ